MSQMEVLLIYCFPKVHLRCTLIYLLFHYNYVNIHFSLFSQVRIFTFSVGQHNYDKAPIQWMACENKGKTHLNLMI